MRCLIILLLFTCFCKVAIAQLSDDEKAVIKLVTQTGPGKPDFCSADANFPAWLIKQVDLYFKTDTIMHLSANEKDELLRKLQAAEHLPKWHQSNTNHIKLFTNKTNPKYFIDTLYYDSLKKTWSKISFYYFFLQFSKPVFIRNNSICFVYRHSFRTCFFDSFYKSEECPATDELNMYVKNNGVWAYKTRIFMAIAD